MKYGKIDGVLHGAGVIEDKLIKDKTPESFDRVFGTKVEIVIVGVVWLRGVPNTVWFVKVTFQFSVVAWL